MFSISSIRIVQALFIIGSLTSGVIGFLGFCILLGTELPIEKPHAIFSSSAVVLSVLILLWILWIPSRREDRALPQGAAAISTLTATGTVMVLATAYQLAAYISLPVDLLSFAESPFVNDILKLRLGMPIYTPPPDNNSYCYTPGTQILTYLISAAFGRGDSVPFYRVVQFSYVILASVMATKICDLMAQRFLSNEEYGRRPLWLAVWFPFLFLVATDSRFNPYTHSLHNDGLALLICMSGFWLVIKHSIAPRPWLLIFMAFVPALGFLVKQSLLIWIVIFSVYFVVSGNITWREFVLFLLGSVIWISAAIGICYLLWGNDFIWWVFTGLGQKEVSLLRSTLHLFQAGIYAIMGLFGGWILVLRNVSRTSAAIWICWLLLFGIEIYTSGIGWVTNHLGPGVIIATCWFFVALLRIWPISKSPQSWWHYRVQEAVAVSSVILLFGALGLIREPRNPVPPDFFRYVGDIEKEFQGLSPEKVLMDFGTWIYLKENILMKDRSAPVSLHVGKNQPEINHAALTATIKRIEEKTYDKILARQLDTGHTAYDFQDRGSGVKAAILANYHEVRRIPGVQGIERWWPEHLVAEILVLVPNRDQDALSVFPRLTQLSYMIAEERVGGFGGIP